jgi:chromosome segregation ATPase
MAQNNVVRALDRLGIDHDRGIPKRRTVEVVKSLVNEVANLQDEHEAELERVRQQKDDLQSRLSEAQDRVNSMVAEIADLKAKLQHAKLRETARLMELPRADETKLLSAVGANIKED